MKSNILKQDEHLARDHGLTSSARWALAALSLSMLMPSLETSIANAGLPTLAKVFNGSFQEVQWVILAYLLVITTVIVSVGRLGDLFGRRSLLLWGVAVFTAASLLCGLAPTLWFLIAARTIQGFGAAIMMALALSFVSETVTKEKIGSAMGLLGTMSALGTTLGPSLGGLLIADFSWRFIFFINLPLGILNIFLVQRYLPLDKQRAKASLPKFDTLGTLLIAVTLAAYALAMTSRTGLMSPLNLALLLTAVCSGALFIVTELRSNSPLIQLARFRDPILSKSLVMSMLVSTVMMATLVVGPFYLTGALGLKAASLGFVLSAGPFVAALTGFPAGKAVDRFGLRRMSILGLAGIASGSLTLSALPPTFGIAGYIFPIVLMTSSYALFQAANNAVIMTGVQAEQRGVISSLLSLSRNLGLITGASVMGTLFAVASARTDLIHAPAKALADGMRTTFAVATILMLAAIALALAKTAQKN